MNPLSFLGLNFKLTGTFSSPRVDFQRRVTGSGHWMTEGESYRKIVKEGQGDVGRELTVVAVKANKVSGKLLFQEACDFLFTQQ